MINVMSAGIATVYALVEYRYKKWWMTNVLAVALATSEIMQDSRCTVAWTMVKLSCISALHLVRQYTSIKLVKDLSVRSVSSSSNSSGSPASDLKLSLCLTGPSW